MNKQYLKMYRLISSLTLILFFASTSTAQTYLTTELSNIKELEKSQTEKVYLQLDRTIFSPGENIWFKAYLLEGSYHTLTSSSNNLHIELIAPNGKIMTSQVVLMHEGVGYGDIKIAHESFKDGVYELRAYTNFMRNFNDAIFFKQNIIINGSGEIKKSKNKPDAIIDLQFFPEGGQLVYDVLNRVAFKAIDQNGLCKNISFTVFDNNNNVIQKTESVHNGMGQFMFTPKLNTTYHALINGSATEQKKINLPQASNAYSILVGNQFNNLLDFTICTSPDNVKGQQISYVIQSRGKLFASNKIKMNAESKLVRIEKEKLPAGISSITIFDAIGIPVCERLIYNQISQEVQIKVSTNKQNITPVKK